MRPSSNLPSGTRIIWDDTDVDEINDGGFSGYLGRDWEAEPYGSVINPLPESYYLSDDEIDEWIDLRQKRGGGLRNLCEKMGLDPLNQARTNYCAFNSVVDLLQIDYAKQGMVMQLSPASVGGPLTRYRNQGYWVSQILPFVIENGVVPLDMWPANAIDKRYDTAESREARKKFRAFECFEIRPRDVRAKHSLNCRGIAVSEGHNWMQHAVTSVEPVRIDGVRGSIYRNSGLYRDRTGHTVLMGNRCVPDEAVCLRAALPV